MSGWIGLLLSAISDPCMYMSSGFYSSRISLHLMTISELHVLYVKFVWSVYTLNYCPNSKFLKSFRGFTIESNLRSVDL